MALPWIQEAKESGDGRLILPFLGWAGGRVILEGLDDSNKQQDGLECFTIVLGQIQHVDSKAATVVVSSLLCPLSSSCLLLGQQGAPPAGCTVNVVQPGALSLAQSLNKLSRRIWKTETQSGVPPASSVSCVLQRCVIINIYVFINIRLNRIWVL